MGAALFFVLGTSAAVYPAAGLIDVVLRYPAGEVLPGVFQRAGVGGIDLVSG